MTRKGAPRWLTWLVWLLIVSGGISLLELVRFSQRVAVDGAIAPDLMRQLVPLVLATICEVLTGLALLLWRKPAGLHVAFALIWLAPVVLICGRLLLPQIDTTGATTPATAFSHLLFILLQSGLFRASGCVAFLLGVPGIQQAFGVAPAGAALMSDRNMARGAIAPRGTGGGLLAGATKISWPGVLCFFLLLPLLSFFPAIGDNIAETGAAWTGTEISRQAACLAFAVPLLVTVIILMKYRRPAGLKLAVVVLWLLPLTSLLWVVPSLVPALIPGDTGSAMGWSYVSLLPRYFGFDLIGAFAWTAYLLKASLLPGRRPLLNARSDVS
jgi:hypothetical protein